MDLLPDRFERLTRSLDPTQSEPTMTRSIFALLFIALFGTAACSSSPLESDWITPPVGECEEWDDWGNCRLTHGSDN